MPTLFGFTWGKNGNDDEEYIIPSPVTPLSDESSIDINTLPGFSNPQVGIFSGDTNSKTEIELINKYRELLNVPEVDSCVEEIVSEAIKSNINSE